VQVIAICAFLLPIAAAFQIFDGTQVVGCGILRGMGRTRAPALATLVGYYAIALPFAWWLGLERGLGLAGIWWGLCLGLVVVASALLVWVRLCGSGERLAD
jgi:MATE family multidrug resistance protein